MLLILYIYFAAWRIFFSSSFAAIANKNHFRYMNLLFYSTYYQLIYEITAPNYYALDKTTYESLGISTRYSM